jgi:hypothetical protein
MLYEVSCLLLSLFCHRNAGNRWWTFRGYRAFWARKQQRLGVPPHPAALNSKQVRKWNLFEFEAGSNLKFQTGEGLLGKVTNQICTLVAAGPDADVADMAICNPCHHGTC